MQKRNNIRELTLLTVLLVLNLLFSFAARSEENPASKKEEVNETVPKSHLFTYILGGGGGFLYWLNNRAYLKNLDLKEGIQAKEGELNRLKNLGRSSLSEKCLAIAKKIAGDLHETEGSLLSQVEESNKKRWFKLNTPAPRTLDEKEIQEQAKEKSEKESAEPSEQELIKVFEKIFKESPESYIQSLKLDGALSPFNQSVEYFTKSGVSKSVYEQLAKLSQFKIVKIAKWPFDIVYWFSAQLGAWVVMPVANFAMQFKIISGPVFIVKEYHSVAVLAALILAGNYLDDKRFDQNLKQQEMIGALRVLEDTNDPIRQALEKNLLDPKIKSNASQNFFNIHLFKQFWEQAEGLGKNFESGDSGLGKYPFELGVTGYALNADVEYLDKLYEASIQKYIQQIRTTPEANKISSGSATYKLAVKEVFKQILIEKYSKELEKHFTKQYLTNPEFTKFVETTLDKYVSFLNKQSQSKKEIQWQNIF